VPLPQALVDWKVALLRLIAYLGGAMALLVMAAALIPWVLLGVFVYWLAPRDDGADALAATLGSRRVENHTFE
jgi:hypothetical protein